MRGTDDRAAVELSEGFSEPGATAVAWPDVERVLAFGKGPYTQTRYRFRSAEDRA